MREVLYATPATLRLPRSFLGDDAGIHRDLVLVDERRTGAVPFRAVADDCGRTPVAHAVFEIVERSVDGVVFRGIDPDRFPTETGKCCREIAVGKKQAVVNIELAAVVVD